MTGKEGARVLRVQILALVEISVEEIGSTVWYLACSQRARAEDDEEDGVDTDFRP